ncbi:MBL fold metallo-hydrolase [Kutzneria buriramensis]|uniref:Glyoxylase-like metal-dependent hydrolase (Beta-lactamase superfamily II) n=1 Tax=Kutzneria buriramensis TaxID=1045776 RepID=A0A3E0HIM4_9PSEU|nr:MBL fold metallo-hydrolase [Kutzneria buriramensis]REH46258.1 glyoxylase-like metal-dependent hydrolase (beta-lactamase superfamily II) [Kutzneria buriramensis]
MARQALRYAVRVSDMAELPTPSPVQSPRGEVPHWSPMASTLIYGDTEAVLVDPPLAAYQAESLAEWVAAFERPLTAIYSTHGHGDHWYGTSTLLERFPNAVPYATDGVIAEMHKGTPGGQPSALFASLFPGQLPDTRVTARPLPDGGLTVDGHELRAVEVGHSDTDQSTVLHVPSLGLVVAGDVIYDNVHQYLGESADGGLEAWLRAIDVVESLEPRSVVAGHKDENAGRGNSPVIIDETRQYLLAAAEILAGEPTRLSFFDQVLARFPDRVNPTTVWLSALRQLPA